jgi:integrase
MISVDLVPPSAETVRELTETVRVEPTKLTQAVIAKLKPGERVRDTQVKGLFADRGATRVSLKIQADLWSGRTGSRTLIRTVRMTLGRLPELSIDSARAEAMRLLAMIKQGIDPKAPERATPGQLSVGAMFERCADHMRTLERADRSVDELLYLLNKYLPRLKDTPVLEVKPSTLRSEHERISKEHGKTVANKTMRAYRSAFNVALKQADDPDSLGANPVRAVTFHPERRKEAVILPTDLHDWYQRLQQRPNPLRRLMHEIGLFSGLRPGTLVSLERAWIQLKDQAIVIPRDRMKTKGDSPPFVLPLSAHLIELVKRSLALSDEFHHGSPWLFPTRSADGREIIATQVVRERAVPPKDDKRPGIPGVETGHILRHTHATIAKAAGVDDMLASLLSDHKVAGIRGVYVHDRALFPQLLSAQEKVTAHILSLIK